MLEEATPAQQAQLKKLSSFIEKTFSNSSYFLININMSIREGGYQVLIELSGPKVYPQEAVVTLNKDLTGIAGGPVKVYVHYIPEVVVTEDGYMSFDGLKKELQTQTERIYEKPIKKILEGSF